MARCSLLVFVILLGTLQTVYCGSGNDSLDPFSPPQRNRKTELKNSELTDERGPSFEVTSGDKIIEKRRLLFNEGEVNSQASAGREFENEYAARTRTNYTMTETETQIPEYQKGFPSWESKQNGFSFSTESANSRNFPEFRLKQPFVGQSNSNLNLNWGPRTDIFGTRQSQWSEEKNKQLAIPDYDFKIATHYDGRVGPPANENDVANGRLNPGRNGEVFSGRVSMTMINDDGVANPKPYNGERVGEVNPGYPSHPNMNYYNRKTKGFWSPNFYRPEKGVIINFNTECPAPRQLNSQMVHKFIFAPKPSPTTLPEISPLQIPETAFVPAHKMSPIYYL